MALGITLRRVWRKDAGRGTSSQGRLTASPIVTGGKIFALDTRARVHAFNARNGTRVWTTDLAPEEEEAEEGFGGGLASDGARVYVTTGFGWVHALDAQTGRKSWSRQIKTPIRAAPTVSDGKVFVTTVNNEVLALSTLDGTVSWRFGGVGGNSGMLVSTSPAVSGGLVVMPYTSGDLIAFTAADGRRVWNDNLSRTGVAAALSPLNSISGRPVVHRGVAYAIAHGGRLVAVDIKTGARLWSRNLSGVQTPWAAGDYLFVVTSDNQLVAVTAKTGKIRWIKQLPAGTEWSGPVLAGGRLVVVAASGLVWSIAPQSGEVVNQFSLDEKIYIPPVVADGLIYFFTDDAELIAMS